MYVAPSGSVVYVLWHMFGSFVLLRALDAVVATAAAEERDDAFKVPFEAAVPFETGSIAAVGVGAVVTTPADRPEESESFGFSAEKSSAKRYVSIEHGIGRNNSLVNWYSPACRRLSTAADASPPTEKVIYTQKSIEARLPHPIQLFLPAMIFARACRTNKLQRTVGKSIATSSIRSEKLRQTVFYPGTNVE